MKRLILIRHGESEANVDHDIYFRKRDSDICLTPKGEQQAADVAKLLPNESNWPYSRTINTIYYSPFKRAEDTARIIVENLNNRVSYNMIEHPLLHERAWGGVFNEAKFEEYEEHLMNDFFFRPPHGESYSDAYGRVHAFLQEMRHDNWTGERIVVTHGEWIRLAFMIVNEQTVKDFMSDGFHPKNAHPYYITVH